MHVVMLAAGLGTRLGGDAPKPLVEIAPGVTLLGNQVAILGSLVGRTRITLVLGHAADAIRAAFGDLASVVNAEYAQTNTAKSLLLALRGLDDDVLWTNADLYFEAPAARRLLDASNLGTRMLVGGARVGVEEVKYRLGVDGAIAELSKSVTAPEGEALGMNLVARGDLPALVAALERVGADDYFEKAIEDSIRAGAMRVMPVAIQDEYCREVDTPDDLAAVRQHCAQRWEDDPGSADALPERTEGGGP